MSQKKKGGKNARSLTSPAQQRRDKSAERDKRTPQSGTRIRLPPPEVEPFNAQAASEVEPLDRRGLLKLSQNYSAIVKVAPHQSIYENTACCKRLQFEGVRPGAPLPQPHDRKNQHSLCNDDMFQVPSAFREHTHICA